MKKILFAALVFMSSLTFAQIKQGNITYSMSFAGDMEGMEQVAQMFAGSSMELYFMPKKSRVDMNMGAMMKTTAISDETQNKALILMSGVMGKIAVTTSLQELEDENKVKMPKYSIHISSETKTILGYTCKKAELTDESGNVSTCWFTTDIEVLTKGQNGAYSMIPGMSLEFETNTNGMIMKFTATAINEKVKDLSSKFSLEVPPGYETKTMNDLKLMGM